MKTLSFWKKSVYSALTFFGTVIILTLVYAGVTNVFYTDLPSVNSGSGLTATSWNNLVNYANKAVKQDTEVLTVTGGKVGIGTTSPNAKLEVNGNIKIADGTQGVGKVLTSDTNGLASWSDPSYQFVTMNIPTGTVINSTNTTFSTTNVTLTQGVWLLNIGYYLSPSASAGYFDVHIDGLPSSGTTVLLGNLPNFNTETAYPAGRNGYVTTTKLISVTSSTASVYAQLSHAWGGGGNYTVSAATLSMIATKIR